MLTYHPIYDIYHGAFRLLALLERLPGGSSEFDKLRILDFYYLFPSMLDEVRVPRGVMRQRNEISRDVRLYENIEDPRRLFMRMEKVQISAARLLQSAGLISSDHFSQGIARRTNHSVPNQLQEAIDKSLRENEKVVTFLTGPFFAIDMYGSEGLKARTKLMEHRYDK